jgi:hypothetical protein
MIGHGVSLILACGVLELNIFDICTAGALNRLDAVMLRAFGSSTLGAQRTFHAPLHHLEYRLDARP